MTTSLDARRAELLELRPGRVGARGLAHPRSSSRLHVTQRTA